MKIEYSVIIKNPIRDSLLVTSDYETEGDFEVYKKENGTLIEGSYSKDGGVFPAFNYGISGESYYITSKKSMSLEESDINFADIEDIFNVIGNNINGAIFKKIQKYFRIVKNDRLERVVEKPSDVFLIKIDKKGFIDAVDADVVPLSNIVKMNESLRPSEIVGYFLVNKPLKVDVVGSYFITSKDLLKLPVGFCALESGLTTNIDSHFLTTPEYSVLTSDIDGVLECSSWLKIDGVYSKNYKIRDKEKVVIETIDDVSPFTLENIQSNTTLVYELAEDNSIVDFLCISNKTLGRVSEEAIKLFDSLKKADSEFLKRYVIRELNINIRLGKSINQVINTSIEKHLKDFKGSYIKI